MKSMSFPLLATDDVADAADGAGSTTSSAIHEAPELYLSLSLSLSLVPVLDGPPCGTTGKVSAISRRRGRREGVLLYGT